MYVCVKKARKRTNFAEKYKKFKQKTFWTDFPPLLASLGYMYLCGAVCLLIICDSNFLICGSNYEI